MSRHLLIDVILLAMFCIVFYAFWTTPRAMWQFYCFIGTAVGFFVHMSINIVCHILLILSKKEKGLKRAFVYSIVQLLMIFLSLYSAFLVVFPA